MESLTETREYQALVRLCNQIYSYPSWDNANFAETIYIQHRTLQQMFVSTVLESIKAFAEGVESNKDFTCTTIEIDIPALRGNTFESKALNDIFRDINSFSWSSKRFTQCLSLISMKMQKQVFLSFVEIIKVFGNPDFGTDPRNQSSHDIAESIWFSGVLDLEIKGVKAFAKKIMKEGNVTRTHFLMI